MLVVKKYNIGNRMKRTFFALVTGLAVMLAPLGAEMAVQAQGPTYTAMQDVYFTKDNCVVYAEPDYTSTVLTTIQANVPVNVIGAYSNGWYRINIGVICYVKMDSLTTAGAIGLPVKADAQIADAQKVAAELGYKFVFLKLNNEKKIKKDIFNSYIDQKVILYVKVNDEFGISFKMLYNDKVKKDISLAYTKTVSPTAGGRVVTYTLDDPTELFGQVAIYQFKEGYDKEVEVSPVDPSTLDGNEYYYMNTYWTEFSEFAYAAVTQVASVKIVGIETERSLSDTRREIMADFRKGIKYQEDDDKAYRKAIPGKLRKDTEYVDYEY